MINLTNDKSIDAEYSIIGALCIDSKVFEKITGKVAAEDFTIPLCASLFGQAEAYIREGKAWDAVIAAEKAEDRATVQAFLIECMSTCPTTANTGLYANIVHKHSLMRNLKRSIEETLSSAEEPQELASSLSAMCREFIATASQKKLTSIGDALMKVYESQKNKESGGRVDTGFPMLDGLLKGLNAGNLCIVGARPGVGKTGIALDIARTAAEKGTVLIYSYEMEDEEIAERMVARYGEIPLDDLIEKKLDDRGMRMLGTTTSYLSRLPIVVNDNPKTKISSIRNEAQIYSDLKLIIVDYLSLIPPESKKERRDLEIAEQTRALKILAKELKVPIMLLAQLNRTKSSNTEPTLEALRESGSIEQDADKVLLMWQYDAENSIIGVKVAKNRRGKTGTVYMEFTGEFMRYMEKSNFTPSRKKKSSYDEVYGED